MTKKGTKESLEKELARLEATRDDICDKMAPLEKALSKNYNAIARVEKKLADLRVSTMNGIDWKYLLQENIPYASKGWKLRAKELSKYDLMHSGYVQHSGQIIIQLKMVKGSKNNLDKTLEGVKLLHQYLEPSGDDYVIYDVLEHTLSEGGHSVHLFVKKDMSKAKVMINRLKEYEGSLEGCLRYIQHNEWYGKIEDKGIDYEKG